MILYDSILVHVPLILRTKARFVSLVKAFISPLQTVSNLYDDYVAIKRDELKYNGQVVYLERVLNDKFDATLRRIYIDDSTYTALNPVVLYRKNEGQISALLYRKSEGITSALLYRKSEILGEDFTVFVPASVLSSVGQNRIKSVVNFYKLASKIYTIQSI